jgi:hypothetical protein
MRSAHSNVRRSNASEIELAVSSMVNGKKSRSIFQSLELIDFSPAPAKLALTGC